MDDQAVRARVDEAEQALAALEELPAASRDTALRAVGALVDLYGEGWARALARLERTPGAASVLTEDDLVGHLLMIHGLHPLDMERRVRRALDEVEATVGADVELLEIDENRAHLRLPSQDGNTGSKLPELVERIVRTAAPELEHVQIESAGATSAEAAPPALVQLRLSRPGKVPEGAAEEGA